MPPQRPAGGRPASQSQPWPAPRAASSGNYSSVSGQGDYPAAWDALEYGKYGKLDMSRLPSMPRGITPPELFPPSSAQSPPNRSNPMSRPPGPPPPGAYPQMGSARNAPFIPPRTSATPPPFSRTYRSPAPSSGRTQSLTSLSSNPSVRFFPAAAKPPGPTSTAPAPGDGERQLTGPEAFQNTAQALRQLGARRMSDSSQMSAGSAPAERARANSLSSQPSSSANQRHSLTLQTGMRPQGPPPPQGRSPMNSQPPRMPSPAQQGARAYSPQQYQQHPSMPSQQSLKSQSPVQSPPSGQQPFPAMPSSSEHYDPSLYPPPPISHQTARKSSSPARLHMSSLAPVLEQPPLELGAAFPEGTSALRQQTRNSRSPSAAAEQSSEPVSSNEAQSDPQPLPKARTEPSKPSQRFHSFSRRIIKPPTPQSSPEPTGKQSTPHSSPERIDQPQPAPQPRTQAMARPRPKSQPPPVFSAQEQPTPVSKPQSPPVGTKEKSKHKYKPQVSSRLLAKLTRPKTPSEPAPKPQTKPTTPTGPAKKPQIKPRTPERIAKQEFNAPAPIQPPTSAPAPAPASEPKLEPPIMPPTPEPEALMTQSKPLTPEPDDASSIEPPSPESKEQPRTSLAQDPANVPIRTSQSSELKDGSLSQPGSVESRPESQSTQQYAESTASSQPRTDPPADAIATPQFKPRLPTVGIAAETQLKSQPLSQSQSHAAELPTKRDSATEMPAEEIAQRLKKQDSTDSASKPQPMQPPSVVTAKIGAVPPAKSQSPVVLPQSSTPQLPPKPVISNASEFRGHSPSSSQVSKASTTASKRISGPPASTPAQIATAQQKQAELLPDGPNPAAKQRWPQARPISALPPSNPIDPPSSTDDETASPINRLRRLSFPSRAKENTRPASEVAPGAIAPEAISSPYKDLAQKMSNENRGRKAVHHILRLQQAENARHSMVNTNDASSPVAELDGSEGSRADVQATDSQKQEQPPKPPQLLVSSEPIFEPLKIDFDENSLLGRSKANKAKETSEKPVARKQIAADSTARSHDEMNPELRYELSSDRPDRASADQNRHSSFDVPSDTDSLKEPIFHAAKERQSPNISPLSRNEEFFASTPVSLKAAPVTPLESPKPPAPKAPEEPKTSIMDRPRMNRQPKRKELAKAAAPEVVVTPEKPEIKETPPPAEPPKSTESPKASAVKATESPRLSMMNRPRMSKLEMTPSPPQRKRSIKSARSPPFAASSKGSAGSTPKASPMAEPNAAPAAETKAAETPLEGEFAESEESMFSGLNRLRSRLAQRVPARQSMAPVALQQPKVRTQSMSFAPRNGSRTPVALDPQPSAREPARPAQPLAAQRRVTMPTKPSNEFSLTLTPPPPENRVELSASDSVVRRTPLKPPLRGPDQYHSDTSVYNTLHEEGPMLNGGGASPSSNWPLPQFPSERPASGGYGARPGHPPRKDSLNSSIEPEIDPRTGRVYAEPKNGSIGSFRPFP